MLYNQRIIFITHLSFKSPGKCASSHYKNYNYEIQMLSHYCSGGRRCVAKVSHYRMDKVWRLFLYQWSVMQELCNGYCHLKYIADRWKRYAGDQVTSCYLNLVTKNNRNKLEATGFSGLKSNEIINKRPWRQYKTWLPGVIKVRGLLRIIVSDIM